MTAPSPWQAIGAGSPLRPYQARVVAALNAALARPASRACLVAPPGAGKTRCALHVAAALGLPVEIRVPTSQLVEQWEVRMRDQLVAVDHHAGPPPARVATYAGLGEFQADALIILDEAHHLGGRWGAQVAERLSAGHRVLGLTATPPVGGAGWDRFISLVGTEPVSVDVPPLVRDGHLCPYQDLVWPVLAEAAEVPELTAALQALAQAETSLGAALDQWMDWQLREHLWELTEARFSEQQGLLVSLCRLRRARGLPLPGDLPPDPEFLAPPALQDRVAVLWAFGPEDPAVRQALAVAGFAPRGKALQPVKDVALRSLSAAGSRVRAALDILEHEQCFRGDTLRALIITDRDHLGAQKVAARAVLEALVSDTRTDPLDPILVTGSALWVDDDLWPRLAARLPDLPWDRADGYHRVEVARWSVAERVSLVTRLLREGVTRCLVGTRHLLGEGWDCPAVNCLIDLSGIAAAVTVNQVRGRALRLDPDDPSKVASLWEVLVLLPGMAGGDRMLERLRERHANTLGIDPQGRIRTGITRLHPALAGPVDGVAQQLDTIQQTMLRRSADTVCTATLWSRGRAYRDRHVWRLEQGPTVPRRRVAARPQPDKLVPAAGTARVRWLARRRWGAAGLAGTGLGLGSAVGLALLPVFGLAAVATGGALALAGVGGAALWLRRAGRQADRRQAVFICLAAAFQAEEPEAAGLRWEQDRAWMEGPPALSRAFAEAAQELLGAPRYPRYLLLEPDGTVWAVPARLGLNRDVADRFAHTWAAFVGPCEVLFARQGRGRELLRQAWQAGGQAQVQVVEEWE